jgi:hypothetical protein
MKYIILLALLCLSLQVDTPLSAMCIIRDRTIELGSVLFQQTGDNIPLTIRGHFHNMPRNATSLLNIYEHGSVENCTNLGNIFRRSETPLNVLTDGNGFGDLNLTSRAFSLSGANSIIGRACRIRIPYVDRRGRSAYHYGCGNIAIVPESVVSRFGSEPVRGRALDSWCSWCDGGHHHHHGGGDSCYCSPWDWNCHRPWWCGSSY